MVYSFNEVLMNMYIVILGIFLTYTLTKTDAKINWYVCIKERKNRYWAYFGFIIFFSVNILYLGIAYKIFIRGGDLFNYCNNLFCTNILFSLNMLYNNIYSIIYDLGRIALFFVPMMISAVLNESIPKIYPEKKEHKVSKKDANPISILLGLFILYLILLLSAWLIMILIVC